jgi:hypothetical protein
MPDTAESILKEVAQHLRHDADVNGSIHTATPYGSLRISMEAGSLWKRIVDITGEPDLIRDVVAPAIRERIEREG